MAKRRAYITLIVLFIITGYLAFMATKVSLDFNFEKFFPSDDEDTEFFNEYRKKFGTDNDFLLIALVNEKGIFKKDFLLKADSLVKKLEKVEFVTSVNSVVNTKEWLKSTLGKNVFESPLIHIHEPEHYLSDSIRLFSVPVWKGNLISEDAKVISIFVQHKQYLPKEGCDKISIEIENLVSEAGFEEFHISGRSIAQRKYVNLMGEELLFFTLTSFVLVVIFLWFSFRTFWGVWVPLLVVLFSAVWIVGFMAITGEKMNILLTLLPTIIFVVGMSDVVHVLTKYLDELRCGLPKMDALKKAYREVALATFLTSFTTAVGFLTLLFAKVEPIRIFGLYTAIGVMLAFILAYTLLPAILILMPAPDIIHEKRKRDWFQFLHSSYSWLIRSKNKVLIGSLILGVVSCWGISMVISNNFLLEDLRESNELKKDFAFFEERFSGVRPFEMAFFVKEKNDSVLYSLETAQEIEKIENYITTVYNAGSLISPNTLVKTINKNLHAGSPDYFKLPESQEELNKIISMVEKFKSGEMLKKVIADNGKTFRIGGKCPDLGSAEFRKRNKLLQEYFEKNINKNYDYKITGTAHLIDKNSATLADGMVRGLMISVFVIAGIAGLMFRSWKMVIISVIPNILPLLMIAGLMGFMEINLKVTTSMIFTISFGIAVDDTIHFISKFKLELANGKPLQYAVKRTYFSTGKAIYITTIILSGGFLTLVFSDFLGTFYIGLLVGLTLIFAVISDMVLLPVLIMMFYKEKKQNVR